MTDITIFNFRKMTAQSHYSTDGEGRCYSWIHLMVFSTTIDEIGRTVEICTPITLHAEADSDRSVEFARTAQAINLAVEPVDAAS